MARLARRLQTATDVAEDRGLECEALKAQIAREREVGVLGSQSGRTHQFPCGKQTEERDERTDGRTHMRIDQVHTHTRMGVHETMHTDRRIPSRTIAWTHLSMFTQTADSRTRRSTHSHWHAHTHSHRMICLVNQLSDTPQIQVAKLNFSVVVTKKHNCCTTPPPELRGCGAAPIGSTDATRREFGTDGRAHLRKRSVSCRAFSAFSPLSLLRIIQRRPQELSVEWPRAPPPLAGRGGRVSASQLGASPPLFFRHKIPSLSDAHEFIELDFGRGQHARNPQPSASLAAVSCERQQSNWPLTNAPLR